MVKHFDVIILLLFRHGNCSYACLPLYNSYMKYVSLLIMMVVLSGCNPAIHSCPPASSGDVVYVIEQGWHAEIALPVEELGPDLEFYKTIFPGARVIMFGYGKKTFITAPVQSFSEYILGPVPGPAAIQVVGIRATPDKAYPPENVITLALPHGGSEALSSYLWHDLAKDASGKPQILSRSTNPDGLFYAAASQYTLAHTCNTWTADVLHAAGLPVSAEGVILSSHVMKQVDQAAADQCPPVTVKP